MRYFRKKIKGLGFPEAFVLSYSARNWKLNWNQELFPTLRKRREGWGTRLLGVCDSKHGAIVNTTVDERDSDMGSGAVYHDNRVRVEKVGRP